MTKCCCLHEISIVTCLVFASSSLASCAVDASSGSSKSDVPAEQNDGFFLTTAVQLEPYAGSQPAPKGFLLSDWNQANLASPPTMTAMEVRRMVASIPVRRDDCLPWLKHADVDELEVTNDESRSRVTDWISSKFPSSPSAKVTQLYYNAATTYRRWKNNLILPLPAKEAVDDWQGAPGFPPSEVRSIFSFFVTAIGADGNDSFAHKKFPVLAMHSLSNQSRGTLNKIAKGEVSEEGNRNLGPKVEHTYAKMLWIKTSILASFYRADGDASHGHPSPVTEEEAFAFTTRLITPMLRFLARAKDFPKGLDQVEVVCDIAYAACEGEERFSVTKLGTKLARHIEALREGDRVAAAPEKGGDRFVATSVILDVMRHVKLVMPDGKIVSIPPLANYLEKQLNPEEDDPPPNFEKVLEHWKAVRSWQGWSRELTGFCDGP